MKRLLKNSAGGTSRCFVIAEAGVNHNGSVEMALELIETAKECGADAIKFQTFKAGSLVSNDAPQAAYQIKNSGQVESQYTMLKRLELSYDEHRVMIARSREIGLEFMSTPFDEASVDFLVNEGMRLFKIPSGEVTNLPLIRHVAKQQKPVVLSTGMCNLSDVEAAIDTLESLGVSDITILHCVSNYPADPADTNLRAMTTLATAFGYPVGYSDHTLGEVVCLAAVAMGASVVEKHFTLDQKLPGPDHLASSEPNELKKLIENIRTIESAMGSGRKKMVAAEASTASVARRSLVATRFIAAGETIMAGDLAGRRPGTGLPTAMLTHLENRVARQNIDAGTLVTLSMFQ